MRSLFMAMVSLCLASSISIASAQDLDITEIMAAKAAYDESQTDARRDALLLALANYQGDPAVETVNAHLIVMTQDALSGSYERVRESASAASRHLEPVKDIVPRQYIDASLLAAVALFNTERDGDAMIEMAHVEGFAAYHRDSTGERPDWATKFRWKAEAWNMAMDAFFETERRRHPAEEDLSAIVASYRPDDYEPTPAASENDEEVLPLCEGRIVQSPKLKYPAQAAKDGLVGAVIIRFDLDTDGKVANPKVLASVPNESFDDEILKTIVKWRYRAKNRKQVGVTCRVERTNIVMPFNFLFGS
ncbi:MAG: energy transducer TonB [Henriciella sp.]|nr:energy transducer TonB [Henriciella sp.]